jgi:hypothetical protein
MEPSWDANDWEKFAAGGRIEISEVYCLRIIKKTIIAMVIQEKNAMEKLTFLCLIINLVTVKVLNSSFDMSYLFI